jgi:hypothetical protein
VRRAGVSRSIVSPRTIRNGIGRGSLWNAPHPEQVGNFPTWVQLANDQSKDGYT